MTEMIDRSPQGGHSQGLKEGMAGRGTEGSFKSAPRREVNLASLFKAGFLHVLCSK